MFLKTPAVLLRTYPHIVKIGFCCKLVKSPAANNNKVLFENVEEANFKTTTVKWITDNRSQASEKLLSIVKHNLQATRCLVSVVSRLPENQRMVRLGSDLLPLYTHAAAHDFYSDTTVRTLIERQLACVGEIARNNSVRLSFHPGQFCCIVSENPNIVESSIQELEYHATMASMMGYAKSKLDFKINVHLSGKLGSAGFLTAWNKMSPEARSCLTIENDEFQGSIEQVLEVSKWAGIVLDIHHHFIRTGEYISACDERIQRVIESWQGVRPVIHYSQSPEEYISQVSTNDMPALETLLKLAPKAKLRAHSNFYPNKKINAWALTHLQWADIQAEAKAKNLASDQLIQQLCLTLPA